MYHELSMDYPPSNVVATPVIRKYNVSMDYPWIIHGLSMDHLPSNVVATPVIRKYNVSMDYPWIIHGSSAIQCSSYPSNSEIQCIHGLSMDHPPSNIVATPVIRKYNVSMDYPWIIHGSSAIQCSSYPSNSEIQCTMNYPWIIRHPM